MRAPLTIRGFKLFADGALGSRGAALLQPYTDAPQTKGDHDSGGKGL
jgi:predicted amidohydrolase YtcJ